MDYNRELQGLQVVTRGNKSLQGNNGYTGLQRVTTGYRGSQVVRGT